MQSIINNETNNRRRRTSRQNQNTTSNNSTTRQRSVFNFNNGYNTSRPRPRPQQVTSSPSPPPVSPVSHSYQNIPTNIEEEDVFEHEEIPSSIHHQIFNTTIIVNTNNLTSELENFFNPNQYYSTFEYESINVRFFHNIPMNINNINNEIENVLNSINERQFQNILNNFQNNETEEFINNTLHNNTLPNCEETIRQIKDNTLHGEYFHYKSVLNNHTCPILLSDFLDDDIISLFKLCNHAIHESTFDKYSKTFVKCPLCNHKLF